MRCALHPLGTLRESAKRELATLFVSEARRLQEMLHRAHGRGDAKAAALAAQALAGASSYFDTGELPAVCRRMEAAAREGDLQRFGDALQELDRSMLPVMEQMGAV